MGALVLVAATVWWLRTNDPERDLADIYGSPRTLELRIPHARHAGPVAASRSRAAGRPRESSALLLAEGRIEREAGRHPENLRWRQLRARAALLRWDYDFALAELERIQLQDRDPSAAMPDLAIAYFERAESLDRPTDYAEALEAFARELRRGPDNPERLFNCGIVYQKLQLPLDAQRVWERYLRIDPSGGWAEEVRARLAQVSAQLRRLDTPVPESDETLLGSADYRSVSQERAHEIAARHGDRFLEDLLASALPASALAALAASGSANGRSDPDAAIPPAREAAYAFRKAGNSAGAARAELEYVYALQRASKPCRGESSQLLPEVRGRSYPWIESQALLAAASCSNMMGDFGKGPRLAEQAQHVAEAAGYPTLALRSLGILAGIERTAGRSAEGWDADRRGLRTFWAGAFPAERAYQFYYSLSQQADPAGYRETTRSLLQHAVATIGRTTHRSVEGIVRHRLALAESLCGNYAEASTQLKRADDLFAGLPQTPAIQFYRLDGEIGVLRMEAEQGRTAHALDILRSMRPRMAEHGGQLTAMKYFQSLAEIERRTGDIDAGEKDLAAAIATSERALETVGPDRDRLAWGGLVADAYRLLVSIGLDRGDTERALEIWEWARGFEARHRASNAADAGDFNHASRVRATRPELIRETILSFAQLGDRMAVWLYDDRGVRFAWLKDDAAGLRSLAARFADLCSDPRADARFVRETGKRLFDALLAPVAAWLDPARKLIVEPDGPATVAPFEAIPLPDGAVLGERFAIEISPGIYYRGPALPMSIGHEGPVLVVGMPALPAELAEELTPLPDALREARTVARRFDRSTLLSGPAATVSAVRQALPTAALFHFAGHALYTSRQSALLMASQTGLDRNEWYLDAKGIGAANLRGCRLVVLSGCSTGRLRETALSDPDSLVRAFLAAGARTVVASRWNVDSQTTERLMELFYQALWQGSEPAGALKLAETAVRSQAETSHPYYWSAFTSFGTR